MIAWLKALFAPKPSTVYPATVLRWLDGDTVALEFAFPPFGQFYRTHVRLKGIDCPEKDTLPGKDAWRRSDELAPMGSNLKVTVHGPDKYAERWLASVTLADGRDLTSVLLSEGHGVAYDGGKR